MTVCTLQHPQQRRVDVHRGPALLSCVEDGPGLAAHERRYGTLPAVDAAELAGLADGVQLRGRGGAGFPFGRKLATAATRRGRAVVVVNLSEGEPASHKDGALARVAPHLLLDGAALTARALGTTEVHVALPGESPLVGAAVRGALAERSMAARDGRIRWTLHEAAEVFVAGQSSAVLELLAGRPNLPVTSWRPAAESGHRRRPTLLSNAETFAQVARLALLGMDAYRSHGTRVEPGTTLLTLDGDDVAGRTPQVVEVPFGTPWPDLLAPDRLASPVLVGGYHGTWGAPGALASLTVSHLAMTDADVTLGAGVVLPLDAGCPVERTASITSYLASQSARRCGPCLNGLPALAAAVEAVAADTGGPADVRRLAELVDGRGACAHPDGTVRLVRSMLASFDSEIGLHLGGRCGYRRTAAPVARRSWLEVSA